MKNKYLLIVILLIGISLSSNGQSKTDIAVFEEARIKGTIAAYEYYLSKFPNGSYAKIVKDQISLTNERGQTEKKALEKVKKKSKVKDLIFGKGYSGSYYIESTEGLNFINALCIAGNPYGIFGFSFDMFAIPVNDPYVDRGFAGAAFSGYISPRQGKGFHAVIGYRPNFLQTFSYNQTYFESVTDPPAPQFLLRSYETSDVDVGIARLHYGFGYRNSFGRLLLGVSYEWSTLYYKADPQERLNFSGSNFKVESANFSFKIGLALK